MVLLAVWAFVGAEPGRALEVDCRACDYCRTKGDLGAELTRRIRAHLDQGRSAEVIARIEGGTNLAAILRPPIALWANRHPEAVRPDPVRLKYRGLNLPNNRLFTSYEPCVKVCGVCLGTDKLAHVFQQGWEYYTISVLDQKGDRLAERYGEWLEGLEPRQRYADAEEYFKRQFSGRHLGYGAFGRTMSGVISPADLEANKAGLRLYKDLARGVFRSMDDYISPQLCEEVNPNQYTPEVQAVVEKNQRQQAAPGAACLCLKPDVSDI